MALTTDCVCWLVVARDTLVGRAAPHGRVALWPTVGEDGRIALEPWPGLGCVKTLGGWVCKLGARVDPGSNALDPSRSKQ